MAKLVSKTYGEALFEIAMEAKQPTGQEQLAGIGADRLADLYEQVQQISRILKENPEFDKLMLHPGITKQEKIEAMEAVFKGRVSDELTGLMELVIQKERYGDLQDIFQYFIDKVKKQKGIGVAYITSAVPLSSKQQEATVARLLGTTPYNSIEPNFDVDESLIGGMVIRIDDRVVDSSIRLKLDKLTRQLLQVRLG